jgi:cytochrome c556
VKFSQQARQTASDLAGALTAGDAAKVKELRTALGGSCTSCHMAYREGSPQTGGYTLKAGVVTQ